MPPSTLALFTLLALTLVPTIKAMPPTCDPGTFRSGRTCKQCPPGTYQPDTASTATSCTPCPPGTYNPFPGAQGLDVCIDCPANTFNPNPAATSKTACTPCPRRRAAPPGSPVCISCRPGTFISLCTTETFGSTSFFPFRGTCSSCGGGVDFFCSIGDPIEDVECAACSEGTFSGPNAFECTTCPDGTFSRRRASKCLPNPSCPPGEEFVSNSCRKCFSSQFNDGTMESCESCPPGFQGEKPTGSTKCVPCPKGTARGGQLGRFDTECQSCDAGQNSDVTGAQVCIPDDTPCPPNFFRSDSGACLQCSQLQRFNKRRNKCVSCPRNQISAGGVATKCVRCPKSAVVTSNFGGVLCSCRPGWGFQEGSDGKICKICKPGTAGLGDGFCKECSPGSFSARPGMETCQFCPAGRIQPRPGQKNCIRAPACSPELIFSEFRRECVQPQTNCPPTSERRETFTSTIPNCFPLSCPAGTAKLIIFGDDGSCGVCERGQRYNSSTFTCDSCDNGETSNGGLSTVCTKCPQNRRFIGARCRCGNFRRVKNGKCLTCPRGTFGFRERDGCTPCPAGTFSNKLDVTECEICRAGTFADKPGSTRCTRCPRGTTTFGLGETGCVRVGSLA